MYNSRCFSYGQTKIVFAEDLINGDERIKNNVFNFFFFFKCRRIKRKGFKLKYNVIRKKDDFSVYLKSVFKVYYIYMVC